MGWGKWRAPRRILQVVDEQHRPVQRVAAPSPRLGARTRVVDEIVDGSILSLRLIADGETYFGGIEAKRQPRLTVVHALTLADLPFHLQVTGPLPRRLPSSIHPPPFRTPVACVLLPCVASLHPASPPQACFVRKLKMIEGIKMCVLLACFSSFTFLSCAPFHLCSSYNNQSRNFDDVTK